MSMHMSTAATNKAAMEKATVTSLPGSVSEAARPDGAKPAVDVQPVPVNRHAYKHVYRYAYGHACRHVDRQVYR